MTSGDSLHRAEPGSDVRLQSVQQKIDELKLGELQVLDEIEERHASGVRAEGRLTPDTVE